jgi:hypothetical protein
MISCWLVLSLVCLADAPSSPEEKALAYLAVEVPRWSVENHCYSCHNNGDAARALFKASQLGRSIRPEATLDTEAWLARPEGWEKNGGDGPFSDKPLARIQFASALASAVESGRIKDRAILGRASTRLAADQAEDGSWKIDEQSRVGSPSTYGQALATWSARETLRISDSSRFHSKIDRADAWLRSRPIDTVMDASIALLAQAFDDSEAGKDRRRRALDLLERGQSRDGGWGPFAQSPPEVFDTALALLALDKNRDQPGVPKRIRQGRAFLVENQQDDGSWVETTRPSGAESYAQRLSTTGWATLALLAVKSP